MEEEIENTPADNNRNQGEIGTPPTDNNGDQNNHGETGENENATVENGIETSATNSKQVTKRKTVVISPVDLRWKTQNAPVYW